MKRLGLRIRQGLPNPGTPGFARFHTPMGDSSFAGSVFEEGADVRARMTEPLCPICVALCYTVMILAVSLPLAVLQFHFAVSQFTLQFHNEGGAV